VRKVAILWCILLFDTCSPAVSAGLRGQRGKGGSCIGGNFFKAKIKDLKFYNVLYFLRRIINYLISYIINSSHIILYCVILPTAEFTTVSIFLEKPYYTALRNHFYFRSYYFSSINYCIHNTICLQQTAVHCTHYTHWYIITK